MYANLRSHATMQLINIHDKPKEQKLKKMYVVYAKVDYKFMRCSIT